MAVPFCFLAGRATSGGAVRFYYLSVRGGLAASWYYVYQYVSREGMRAALRGSYVCCGISQG